MLKLFFIICTPIFLPFTTAALMILTKSQVEIDWMCHETNSWGNCSTLPKITDWLQTISDKIDSDEYTDIDYCPFEIVERHARCMGLFLETCQQYLPESKQHFASSFMPRTEETAETHCVKGRPYKNEFRAHTACTKLMFDSDNQWRTHEVNQEVEFGLIPMDTDFYEKCYIYRKYWQMQNSWIREKCGMRTEKFSRQVLSNMWPIMGLLKLCGEQLSTYGYLE
ncbi:uncharacterized protein LOC111034805 [Myzus persicae]|uniref:uncharacterized protein LOC111034805 n=1 Tax=Myzus persicae TaxID=13164 RepID=UPI000B932686|nr:uncharacterized protein LOC111034805 [Myzus persicae]